MKDEKQIDLKPGEDWQTAEGRPNEPFFGSGALYGLGFLSAGLIITLVKYYLL